MADTLRAGILGTGFMGQTHGKNLATLDSVEIAAICDTRQESAQALKDTLGVEAVLFDDFDAMLEKAALDVLYVCLPPCAHDGQVVKAAQKGVHLFLEKPIAPDVASAQAMADAIAEAGVVSQVGFHLRFRKSVQKMKAYVDSGDAGRGALFAGRYWCNMLGNAWWRDRAGSGGQIFEQVIHVYDMAQYLFGPAQSVTGLMANLCHTNVDDYSIEDVSVGSVQFASGAMGSVVGSNCALPERFIGDFRVVCEKAVLDYRSTGDWRDTEKATLYRHDGATMTQEDIEEDGNPYLAETEDFITAILSGGSTVTPVKHGLSAVKLVSSVIASAAQQGTPVTL